ncbi:anthranilate synthase component II [Nanoarchaeota archaeon]
MKKKKSTSIKPRILFIDNFDSFTYNLVDEFEKRNCEVLVYRNDVDLKIIADCVKKFKPQLIVISPGPSNPKNAGNSVAIIRKYKEKIPIFGVCLGHQCIIEAFKGKVDSAPEIIHGKPSKILHGSTGIFQGLENPLQAGRYHSLCSVKITDDLKVTAETDGIVMAIQHKDLPIYGVQFHPESILTPTGGKLIENVINIL